MGVVFVMRAMLGMLLVCSMLGMLMVVGGFHCEDLRCGGTSRGVSGYPTRRSS
jgi:hypothetical protein